MITLFHGTQAREEILESGFNTELVFLTARNDVAEDYGFDIISVVVDEDDLLIDLDQAGAIGITVEQANGMTGNDFDCAEEYVNAGYSVCVKSSLINRFF